MNIEKRLAEIAARKVEIRGLLEGDPEANLDEINTELKALEAEETELRRRQEMAASIQACAAPEVRTIATTAEPKVFAEPKQPEWRNFGEFLQAVRFNQHDRRLQFKEFEHPETRDLQMVPGAQGGFLVPEQFSTQLLQIGPQDAIVRPRATVIPAGSPPDAPITFPVLDHSGARGVYSGVTVVWIGEGEQKPPTEPAFREITITPREVAAHTVVTDKLLRNTEAASVVVRTLLRRAILAAEDVAFLSGLGVNQPVGIIGHGSAINVVRAGANQISYADVVGMYARAKFGGPLCWIASPTTLPQLMRMTDGAQGLIWQPNARDGAPGTLLGLPVFLNERSPVLGQVGDLILADLQYYLIKDGSGIYISASEHVQFINNKTVIKAFWNVDGQPWLTSPLLLEDGVSTVSPFVILN